MRVDSCGEMLRIFRLIIGKKRTTTNVIVPKFKDFNEDLVNPSIYHDSENHIVGF